MSTVAAPAPAFTAAKAVNWPSEMISIQLDTAELRARIRAAQCVRVHSCGRAVSITKREALSIFSDLSAGWKWGCMIYSGYCGRTLTIIRTVES